MGNNKGWREHLDETSLHGVGNAADSKRGYVRRFLWVLCCLGSTALVLYFCTKGILELLEYNTQTKQTYIEATNATFPSVTICNVNGLRQSYIQTQPPIVAQMLSLLDVSAQGSESSANGGTFNIPPSALNFSLSELVKEGSHQAQDMFQFCSWASSSSSGCDAAQYFLPRTTTYGRCYTFHSHEYIKQHGELHVLRAGAEQGLHLRINIEQDEYAISSNPSAGIKVLVHDPWSEPLVEQLGFLAAPGTETAVVLKHIKLQGLPLPPDKPQCVDTEADTFTNPLRYSDRYTPSACSTECAVNYTRAQCQCVPYFLGDFPDSCNIMQMVQCGMTSYRNFTTNATALNACNCKRTCSENIYEVSLSSAVFPSNRMISVLAAEQNQSTDFVRDNLLEMRVFFGELSYNYIETVKSYSLNMFWGDIGGYLGLCLGASLLSVVEIIEFVFVVCRDACKKNNTLQNSHDKVQAFDGASKKENIWVNSVVDGK